MSFKLLDSFLESGCSVSCFARNHKRISIRLDSLFEKRLRYCSESCENGSDSESKLKKILGNASPLKPSKKAEAFWATSPFPAGTVFRGSEEEQDVSPPVPEETSIIMFPGQGNQFVGMAQSLVRYPVALDMFSAASEILGYDLLKVCQSGPEKKLNETEYCQPATLVCSLAALEKLKDEKPWAINNCVGTCGYSLGEFSALVFAGCLSFERAVQLVKVRAEAMSLCCKAEEGGMMTVLYGPGSKLTAALTAAVDHCKNKGIKSPHCSVASYLFPGCKVIAGNAEALNFLIKNSREYKLKKLSKLQVSGAFHTELMRDAADAFHEALNKTEVKDPLIYVYGNLKGKAYKNANDIKHNLPKQIFSPVKWEQTMHTVFKRPRGVGYPFVYECGPGNSLSKVLKKINSSPSLSCYSVKL